MPIDRKFRKQVRGALNNQPLRRALDNFVRAYPQARENAYKGIDFQQLREQVQEIKRDAVAHFDELADRFQQQISSRGATVHRAEDGKEVAAIVKNIARQRQAKLCVKSKSMATEEICLNHSLEDMLRVVETDLGEWIIQQVSQKPTHMVMPAIHLTRQECADIFTQVTGRPVDADIPGMVKLAREILRKEFLAADIGISGCNVAVADTGTMVILTNEGNGRLTATLPPVHVVLMGYEKLVGSFKDIAPLITAVPKSATCQPITSYVTMISGPSQSFKGPEEEETVQKELHVILLDNGRKELLRDPVFSQIGHCVRCASCLNVCPVYRLVGGQVYGDVYTGGIGALLTAFVHSPKQAEKIQELCLGCGKCLEFCPAKIDIPGLMLKLRDRVRRKIPPPFLQRMMIRHVVTRKKWLDLSVKTIKPVSRLNREIPKPAKNHFRQRFMALRQKIEGTKPHGTVAFFYGCMIDYVNPEIGESVVHLLNRAGFRVTLPEQACCGAPALYSGMEKDAAATAREYLNKWKRGVKVYDYLVTACPTCTYMLKKQWPLLVKDSPELLEVAQQVAEKAIDFIALFHRLMEENPQLGDIFANKRHRPLTVTYHDSCHLKRGLGVHREPRHLLSSLPGVEWVEMEESDRCCGFAGTYSLKLPQLSKQLQKEKVREIKKSRANLVLTDCPGCLLSIKQGLEKEKPGIDVMHSAVFLAQRSK